MKEPEVEFVHPKRFSIDVVVPGSTMAVRADRDEVVVVVRLACGPRNDVVNVNVDVPTGGDSAAVTSLDENAASEFGWNSGSIHG